MNVLIGDIGNTNTKICIIDSRTYKIKKIIYLNSSEIVNKKSLKTKLSKVIKKNYINKVALFSSVVPKYEKIISNHINKYYKIKFKEIKDKSIVKIVKINIKEPKQVGSDRIANAAGVYKKYKTNCIVLDFGTATTFDVVTKNGIYKGGVIAPGVNLSIKSLSNSADLIPNFSLLKPKKTIGKNTIEALHSGFYWGYSGLINNIILKIEKETKKKYKIIFTGGYAALFKTSIIRPFKIDRNITINGIIEIFKKNNKYLS
jgi:type III pantothenate kinase